MKKETKIKFYQLLFLMGFIISCSKEKLHVNVTQSSRPISAEFTLENISNNGFNPSVVRFTNNSSAHADEFEWNFGDPSSSENTSGERSPIHLYENPGIYTTTLVAKNSISNLKDTFLTEITIKETLTFSRNLFHNGIKAAQGNDILVIGESNFLVVGSVGSDDESKLLIELINQEGDRLTGFPKIIDKTGYNSALSATITNDGNFALTGYMSPSRPNNFAPNTDQKIALWIMDSNFNIKNGFPKTYNLPNRGGLGRSLVQSSNDEFVVVGDINGSGGSDFFVTLTNANGVVQSSFPKDYNEFDFTEHGNVIKQLANGELVMMGSDVTVGALFFHRMDGNGNDIAGFPKRINRRGAQDFVELPDGSLMVIGSHGLTKMDIEGNELPGFPKNIVGDLEDIILTNEEDIVFVGEENDAPILYRADLNGNILSNFPKSYESTFDNNDKGGANAVKQTIDGGFIMTVNIINNLRSGLYVLKVDRNGNM